MSTRWILEPERVPNDHSFHTVDISESEDGDYFVDAKSNDLMATFHVGSVAIDSDNIAIRGDLRLEAAGRFMTLDYVDFTEEYGYNEIQVNFEGE